MDRQNIYAIFQRKQELDYEKYLNTEQLLACQKDFLALCTHDELQFQIVHQVEELWLKLIVHTLLEINECIEQENTNRICTLFKRVHLTQKMMISQLELLETMSPKEYQLIREQLGNGSGKESPGFKALSKTPAMIWSSFNAFYLSKHQLSIEKIYSTEYKHCDAYMVAESMAEFDELSQKFFFHHIQLIYRSIGFDSKSLKGHSVELLHQQAKRQFYPEIWQIRTKMTDEWGFEYGVERETISNSE